MGKRLLLSTMLLPVILPIYLLFNSLLLRNSFSKDAVVYIFISICLISLFIALIMLVIGKCGDGKLKKLIKTGKAYEPIHTTVFTSFIYDHSFTGDIYNSFRVKCVVRNAKGGKFTVKSQRLAVCEGWLRIIPQPANVACEAMVYVNPNKPGDFAVEVSMC